MTDLNLALIDLKSVQSIDETQSFASVTPSTVHILNVKTKKVLERSGSDVIISAYSKGNAAQVWNLYGTDPAWIQFGKDDANTLSRVKVEKGAALVTASNSRAGWALVKIGTSGNYAIHTWMNGPDLGKVGTWGVDGSGSKPVLAKIDDTKEAQQWTFYNAK